MIDRILWFLFTEFYPRLTVDRDIACTSPQGDHKLSFALRAETQEILQDRVPADLRPGLSAAPRTQNPLCFSGAHCASPFFDLTNSIIA